MVTYELWWSERKGDLVADGVRPVRIVREVRRRTLFYASTLAEKEVDREACRAEWIDRMLRDLAAERPEDGTRSPLWWRMGEAETATGLGPPARVEVKLRWAGDSPFRRQIRKECEALHRTFGAALRALVDGGLVPEDDAPTLLPRIRIEIRDERGFRLRPLPPIEPPPPSNLWRPRRKVTGWGVVVRAGRSGPASPGELRA